MAPKKITLKDVALKAGVSTSAVSQILGENRNFSFSEETVERVRNAAKELDYRPCRRRSVAQNRCVLIVCPNVTNGYYSTLVQSIQKAAEQHHFASFVATTYRSPEKEESLLASAGQMGFCGIIFTMMPQKTELLEKTCATIPTVVIGDSRLSIGVDTVELDNFGAGRLLGQHLFELGHRHIGFLSTTLNEANAIRRRRLEGIQSVFAAHKETCVHVLARDITPEEELDLLHVEYRAGFDLTMQCLKKKLACTALVAVNDSVAYGVLDALAQKGIQVPGQCSVCGFDNLAFSRLACIELTSVEHHIEEKGRNAFALVLQRCEGSSAACNITRIEFAHHLVPGKTTGPCPDMG